MEYIRGELSEYLVLEKLQGAGYDVYKSLTIPGIDFLARRGKTELKIQVKSASQYRKSKKDQTFGVSSSIHGWQHVLHNVDIVLVVLPDNRIFVLPKNRIKRALSYPRVKNIKKITYRSGGVRITFGLSELVRKEKLLEFDAARFYLFTDVEVYPELKASKRAARLPSAIPGYINSAAFFPDENKVEIYFLETLRVIRRLYNTMVEEEFIQILIKRLTANVIHEMEHAVLQRSFMNEREIQRMAIVMTQ